MNIVIIDKNSIEINKTAQRLKEIFNVEVIGINQDIEDFPKNPLKALQEIMEKTKNLDVQILVNNVGVGHVKDFLSSQKCLQCTMALNLFPIIFLSKGFSELVKTKDNAGIINVSSVAGVGPVQRFAVYAATKAFGMIFSQVLSAEFPRSKFSNNSNIKVFCIQPGMIDTPGTQYIKQKTLIISKNDCAREAVSLLGKRTYSNGHWKHDLIYIVMNFVVIFVQVIGRKLGEAYEHN